MTVSQVDLARLGGLPLHRLDHLIANGPSEFAFGWADLPSARIWQEKRCA